MATPHGLVVALFIGLVATTGAYLLIGYGLRHVSAPVAATLQPAETATAAGLGILVPDERASRMGFVGLVAVGAALMVMLWPTPHRA